MGINPLIFSEEIPSKFINFNDLNLLIWQVKQQSKDIKNEDTFLTFVKRLGKDANGKNYETYQWTGVNLGNITQYEIYGDPSLTTPNYNLTLFDENSNVLNFLNIGENGQLIGVLVQTFAYKIKGKIFISGENIYFLADYFSQTKLFTCQIISSQLTVISIKDICQYFKDYYVPPGGKGVFFTQIYDIDQKISYSDQVSFTEGKISFINEGSNIEFLKSSTGKYIVKVYDMENDVGGKYYYYNGNEENPLSEMDFAGIQEEGGITSIFESENVVYTTSNTFVYLFIKKSQFRVKKDLILLNNFKPLGFIKRDTNALEALNSSLISITSDPNSEKSIAENSLSFNNSILSCDLGIYKKKSNITLVIETMIKEYELKIFYDPTEKKASLWPLIIIIVIGFSGCFVLALLCCRKDTDELDFKNIKFNKKKFNTGEYKEFDVDYIYDKAGSLLKDFVDEKKRSLKTEDDFEGSGDGKAEKE